MTECNLYLDDDLVIEQGMFVDKKMEAKKDERSYINLSSYIAPGVD